MITNFIRRIIKSKIFMSNPKSQSMRHPARPHLRHPALVAGLIITLLISQNAMAEEQNSKTKLATFAGGCFWCMEPLFNDINGVINSTVGYSGGSQETANYQDVSTGTSKHIEAIQIEYNPDLVTYNTLLELYIKGIDPTDSGGQFADRGTQYLTAIFYHDDEQRKIAKELLTNLNRTEKFRGRIATYIDKYKNFFAAEEYHQDYYKKNPMRYNAYKYGSGRVRKLKELWGE